MSTPLPAGFVLESNDAALPEGFVLEGAETQPIKQPATNKNSAKNIALEGMAGANRAALETLDFLGPDQVNAILQLVGSDKRVPTLMGSDLGQQGASGNFMEPGMARDAVRAGSEVATTALGVGSLMRKGAVELPNIVSNAERTFPAVVRQMGQTTAGQDLAIGGSSGVGAVIGGEAGQEVGGDTGRQVGSFIGSLAAPAATSAVASRASALRNGVIRPGDKALIEGGKDAGIPVLTSDISPPQTFAGKSAQQMAEKIPLAGTAGMRQSQQELRQRAVNQFADKYNVFSYEDIVSSLRNQKDKIKAAAGAVLEDVGRKVDSVGTIQTDNTKRAIASARAELNKPNVLRSSSADDDLQKLIEAVEQPQTFTSLKENRTAFREIVQSTDKADRSQLTSRAKALLERVGVAMTQDMESAAKGTLDARDFARWKRANSIYAEQAKALKQTKLKAVLDKGDVTPEKVKSMLFSQNPSEVKSLYNSLSSSGRSNARAAIISKVVDNVSRRQAGFTPNSFASELKKFSPHTDVFFKGGEKRQLEGLRRALEATTRAQDASLTTPTGQQLIGGLSIAGIYLDAGATLGTAGTIGGLARLYETVPVRNALLRLGSTPPDSGKYAQSLASALIALQTAASQESSAEADTPAPQ